MTETPSVFDMPQPEEPEPEATEDAPLAVVPTDSDNPIIVEAAKAGVLVSQKGVEAIDSFLNRARFGHQGAMPMRCKGMSCPFISMCPLAEANEPLPVGKKCPVERGLVNMWVSQHVETLGIDPNDPDYAVDMDMVFELAGLELVRNRAAAHMSEQPELFKEKVVGYSPQGDPIYDDKPNMAMLAMEKYGKRVDKLREQLIATRKSQAQVGALASDNSVRSAKIMSRAKQILEERMQGSKAVDVEYTEKKDEGEES